VVAVPFYLTPAGEGAKIGIVAEGCQEALYKEDRQTCIPQCGTKGDEHGISCLWSCVYGMEEMVF